MTHRNIKLGALFSVHLFVVSIYALLFSDIQIKAFLIWPILGIFINLLLGIILVRSVLDKITIFYSLLLCLLVYMFIFLGSPIKFLYHFSFSIVSYLPAMVLYFLVLFFYGKHTKITTIFLVIQFLLSFIRDTLTYLNESLSQFNLYFFFIGIITFYSFSSYLFLKGPREKLIFTKKQNKRLLISTTFSFLPFILLSLVASVLTSQKSLENSWTLIFFLVLPLVVADILTKENLIYQQFWKTTLIQDFILLSFVLVLLTLMIGYLFSFSVIDMIALGNFLLFFFFTTFVIVQLYNMKKKTTVIDQLLSFPMEKQFLTHHLLQTQHMNSIKSFLFETLSFVVNLTNLDIININNLTYSDIKSCFEPSSSALEEVEIQLKKMRQSNEEVSTLRMDGCHYLVMNVDNYHSFLIIKKDNEYFHEEITLIKKLHPIVHEMFLSARNISNTAFHSNNQFYTPFEKAIFLKEVDLSEKYQTFIAHYLHDEILQSVLAIRQSAYQKNSSDSIRDTIEHTVEEIELSIRRKIIEWEASDIPDKSLKTSVGELVQKLVIMYDKAIFIQINIPETLDLPVPFQQFIFRSIRELLVNTYKHSNATMVTVTLQIDDVAIHLLVEDDGNGVQDTIDFKNKNSHNFGLYSIYQHTHAFNGSMTLSHSKKGGLAINISFPLNPIMKGLN